jgi:GNAT superfamily N-acetyltransferase
MIAIALHLFFMLSILPFSQLSTERRREAAALLFAHLPHSDRSERIEQWLTAIANNDLNPANILIALWNNCVVGIQVVEVLPGNSAALWAIRSRPFEERIAFEDQLLQSALQLLRTAGVKLAQCLLHHDEHLAADAILRNGFQRLTTVRHMRAVVKSETGAIPNDITFQPFEQSDAAKFQQVLVESFEGTLDCPELNNLRSPEEILAGHRASAPELSRWWLIHDRAAPAGVLILAEAPAPEHWDLAYLGVVPSARRKGVGRATVAFALQQTAAASKRGMTLMVDERNVPAIRLYENAGFEFSGARDVYLWKSTR